MSGDEVNLSFKGPPGTELRVRTPGSAGLTTASELPSPQPGSRPGRRSQKSLFAKPQATPAYTPPNGIAPDGSNLAKGIDQLTNRDIFANHALRRLLDLNTSLARILGANVADEGGQLATEALGRFQAHLFEYIDACPSSTRHKDASFQEQQLPAALSRDLTVLYDSDNLGYMHRMANSGSPLRNDWRNLHSYLLEVRSEPAAPLGIDGKPRDPNAPAPF